MQIKNTHNQYGIISIILHWLMAFLIIGMLCAGLIMINLPVSSLKVKIYGIHKEFGLLILMLAIVRLTWRLGNITPGLLGLPTWERISARLVHGALYVFMFLQPITGWFMSMSAGIPVSFFGLFTLPNFIP